MSFLTYLGYIGAAYDWCKRHALLTILVLLALMYIGFERETLRTLATCFIYACAVVIFSGITTYAYTTVNFIQERNTDAIAKIYLGNCLLFGLVAVGVQFTQFR